MAIRRAGLCKFSLLPSRTDLLLKRTLRSLIVLPPRWKTLPLSDSIHTPRDALRELFEQLSVLSSAILLTDEAPFGHANGPRGRKRLLPPEDAEIAQQRLRKNRPPRTLAIQRLLERAHQLKQHLDESPGLTRLALAKELGLDPSRVSQILNLLNLAPEIQAYIKDLPPTNQLESIGDRKWMRIARIRDQNLQIDEFKRLKAAP